MDVGQCSKPGSDVKSDYGLNETSVECCQNGLVDLKFAKEKETLLALGEDGISMCFEVDSQCLQTTKTFGTQRKKGNHLYLMYPIWLSFFIQSANHKI